LTATATWHKETFIVKKLIAAILFSALCGLSISSAVAQMPQNIRIGYPSISSRQAQLWIAKDEGIFRKYGLDVELRRNGAAL